MRDAANAWSSPVIAKINGKDQVIVSSGGTVKGYAAADGSELWSLEGVGGNSIPSPTARDGHLFVGARIPEFSDAKSAARSNLCIELEAGDQEQTVRVRWRAKQAVCDYASPVVANGHVYYLSKRGVFVVHRRSDGRDRLSRTIGRRVLGDARRGRSQYFLFWKERKDGGDSFGPHV